MALALGLVLAFVLAVQGSPDAALWSVVSGGGGTGQSDGFSLDGTLGQGQPVGVSSSPSFGLGSGFWPGVVIPEGDKTSVA